MTLLRLSGIVEAFLVRETKQHAPACIGFDSFSIWGKMVARSLGVPSFSTVSQFAPHPATPT